MRNCIPAVIVVGAVLASDSLGQPLRVFVQNFAGVTPQVLERAEVEASRILGTAEIAVIWTNCMESGIDPGVCPAVPGSLALVLRILPPEASTLPVAPGALGFAVPSESYAAVLYGRVASLPLPNTRIGRDVLLGHVVAHELGHVLLGTGGHSKSGIMTAAWKSKTLAVAARGQLVFDSKQKRLMQHNVIFRARGNTYSAPIAGGPCGTTVQREKILPTGAK
jgi:hypothetical protein